MDIADIGKGIGKGIVKVCIEDLVIKNQDPSSSKVGLWVKKKKRKDFEKQKFINHFQLLNFRAPSKVSREYRKVSCRKKEPKDKTQVDAGLTLTKKNPFFLLQVLLELQNLPEKVSNQSVFNSFELRRR